MPEWKPAKIGDFVHIKHGYAFKGVDITDEPTNNILVTPGNFHIGGGFKFSKLKYYKGDIPDEYILQPNDIIVTMTDLSKESDTLGYSAKVPVSDGVIYLHNQRIGLLQFFDNRNEIVPDFLYWVMRSREYQGFIVGSASGSSVMHTSPSRIREYEFECPEPDEQKAIASVLSSLDDKIDLLHRQNKTLEAMAENLFRQWFVEAEGYDCPITELVEFNPSRRLPKGVIAPYLEMAALSTDTFNPSGWYGREFTSGSKFVNGDTLLARITPCLENGKTAYVTFLSEDQVGWGSTEFIVMRPVTGLHPLFAYVLARNTDFRDYAEGCMAGSSGRQRVDLAHLRQYRIVKPAENLVTGFNEFLTSIEPKLQANMYQIETLGKLRDTLLPKLISGEVRVA